MDKKQIILLLIVLFIIFKILSSATEKTMSIDSPSPEGALKIPAEVISNTSLNDKFSAIFKSNKKVIFINGPDCRALDFFAFAVKNELRERKISKNYEVLLDKNPKGTIGGACSNGSKKCFYSYLIQNCYETKVCVIHPLKKELFIIDGDPNVIADRALIIKDW